MVTCPSCESTNIKLVSSTKNVSDVGTPKVHSTRMDSFECRNCSDTWVEHNAASWELTTL